MRFIIILRQWNYVEVNINTIRRHNMTDKQKPKCKDCEYFQKVCGFKQMFCLKPSKPGYAMLLGDKITRADDDCWRV